MSQPNNANLQQETRPQAPQPMQGTPENPLLDGILSMAKSITSPLQSVFNLRGRTQQAKERVKELRDRVDRLEAQIQNASKTDNSGSRLDKLR